MANLSAYRIDAAQARSPVYRMLVADRVGIGLTQSALLLFKFLIMGAKNHPYVHNGMPQDGGLYRPGRLFLINPISKPSLERG